jgi:hypothetical protein
MRVWSTEVMKIGAAGREKIPARLKRSPVCVSPTNKTRICNRCAVKRVIARFMAVLILSP